MTLIVEKLFISVEKNIILRIFREFENTNSGFLFKKLIALEEVF